MDFNQDSTKEILNSLDENATESDITTLFKKLSKKYHPDKGGSDDAFQSLKSVCDIAKQRGMKYVKMLQYTFVNEVQEDEEEETVWSYDQYYDDANIDDFLAHLQRITQSSSLPSTVRIVQEESSGSTSSGSTSAASSSNERARKRKVNETKLCCKDVLGGNEFCTFPCHHEGPHETPPDKRHALLKGKSIILYGKDKLARAWKLKCRPRLLIQDATLDLKNLSSRKLQKTCSWLDGPLSNKNPYTLNNAVCEAYKSAGFSTSNNAYLELLFDASKEPEELYCIHGLRDGYTSRSGWVDLNGGGFEHLLK